MKLHTLNIPAWLPAVAPSHYLLKGSYSPNFSLHRCVLRGLKLSIHGITVCALSICLVSLNRMFVSFIGMIVNHWSPFSLLENIPQSEDTARYLRILLLLPFDLFPVSMEYLL